MYNGQFPMGYDYQYGAYNELGAQGIMPRPMPGRFQAPAPQLVPQYPQQAPQLQAQQRPQRSQTKWQKTAVAGTSVATLTSAAFNITITPQHDFVAQDLTFSGTTPANTTCTSVDFADHNVWNEPTGIPTEAFAPASFLRGVVKGARIRGGLSIRIQGVIGTAAGAAQAVLTGLKPQTTC